MTVPKKLDIWQPSQGQRRVVGEVAEAFGFDAAAMVGRSRKAKLIPARHAVAWVLKQRYPRLSWPQIGKIMGGRDHSTAIYGARQCALWRENDEEYRTKTDELVGAGKGYPVPPEPRFRSRRLVQAIAKAAATEPRQPEWLKRNVLPKNELSSDDTDALKRGAGSQRLQEALAQAGYVR